MCLVVFGSRAVESELGSGRFYCPKCDDDRPYLNKEARRWFTLFFIPVIPLNRLGSYIECPVCKTAYTGEVLNVAPSPERQKSLKLAVNDAMKRLMVGIVCADGEVDPEEVSLAVKLGQGVIGSAYNHDYFAQDVARYKGQDFMAALRTLGSQTDVASRELLVRVAVVLAVADGQLDVTEFLLIERIGEALGVPVERVHELISEATQFGLEGRPPEATQRQPVIS